MACAITAIIIGAGASLFVTGFRRTQTTQNDQFGKLEIDRLFGTLEKRIYNATWLTPAEGLDAPGNQVYRGVYGVNGTDPIRGCQYLKAANGTGDQYSILRYTTILNLFAPEPTLKAWDETTIAGTPIPVTLSLTNTPPAPGYVFQSGIKNVSEIVLIDADSTDIHRYSVNSVKVDKSRRVLPFDYNAVSVSHAKTVTGKIVTNLNSKFITGSLVLGSETRLLCIDPKGRIIEMTEPNLTTQVLFDPRPFLATISQFEIRFMSTPNLARLDPTAFIPFPSDVPTQSCLNAALISLTLNQGNLVKPFKKVVLINNFNAHRALNCGG